MEQKLPNRALDVFISDKYDHEMFITLSRAAQGQVLKKLDKQIEEKRQLLSQTWFAPSIEAIKRAIKELERRRDVLVNGVKMLDLGENDEK